MAYGAWYTGEESILDSRLRGNDKSEQNGNDNSEQNGNDKFEQNGNDKFEQKRIGVKQLKVR